jgi:hypothetical protein
MAVTRIKGISMIHMVDYLKAVHGAGSVDRVAARLSAKSAKALKVGTAFEWFDLPTFVEIERTVIALYYGGDIKEAWRMGKYDMEESMNKVYRFLFRFFSPATLIDRSAKVFHTFVEGGNCAIERVGGTEVRATIEGIEPLDECYCHDLRGSFLGLISLCGLKSGEAEHVTCRLRGDKTCSYHVRW